jgi:chromosome segregation ATPase
MHRCCAFALLLFVGVLATGCGADKAQALKAQAEIESLQQRLAQLEAEKAQVTAQLASAQQELQRVAEIKQGYEAARVKFAAGLKQVASVVGPAESPLPPFEDLRNSDWVGKLTPGAELTPQLKALEGELKGIFGNEAPRPAAKP